MKSISLLFVLLTSSLLLHAQDKQVTFDPGGKIRTIDAVLAKKIGYFTEHRDFQQAMLFQQNDSTYLLEIITGKKNENFRTRKIMTAAETELFLADINERLKSNSPHSMLDQEGRSTFLIMNSLVSYSFYGTAVSAILTDDFSPAVYLLSAGAGFVAPMLITRDKDMSMSQAIMASYGQTRGIAHGMLLPLLIGGEEVDFRLSLGMGLAGSITETLIGYNWAQKKGLNVGQASTIGLYSDLGMVVGLGVVNSLGLFEIADEFTPNLFALTTLAGAAGGLLYGNALSKKDYYSQGDVVMTGNMFLLGAYLPLTIMAAAEVENPRWYTAFGTLGAAAGIWGGDKLAQQFDFSNRQSMFASLSMIGGGFLGAGIGHLIEESRPNDDYWYDYDPTMIAIMSALGAATGLGLSILNYTKDINKENKDLSLKLQFNPLGFANSRLTAGDPTGRSAIPVVMGRVRF